MATYQYVRRYNAVLTEEQQARHTMNRAAMDAAFNHIVAYLEKRYPYTRKRRFPTNAGGKRVLRNELIKSLRTKLAWMKKSDGVHNVYSQSLQIFVDLIITNFGEYQKKLNKARLMTAQDKDDYKANKGRHKNPQHRSWYRKGSLAFLRGRKQVFKTVTYSNNGKFRIISDHEIFVQQYGLIYVRQNIRKFRGNEKQIAQVKIKMRRQGDYEIQFVLNAPRVKSEGLRAQGVDMNMKHNKIFHTTNQDNVQERYYLSKDISERSDKLSDLVDALKSQRDTSKLSQQSKSYRALDNSIRYWARKRENILNNAYRHMVRDLMSRYDITIMEKLTTFDMRRKKRENRGFNKKLTKVRFGTLIEFAQQYANHYNKRLILVKPDMTSQVERGASRVKKHALDESVVIDGVERRDWFSEIDGHFVSRDGNSSGNVLDWGLNPKVHYLYPQYPVSKLAFEK
ncbi:hypothetical protein [Weissella confusa]|uniref:hypothetical protein n=1 Tax=Weissella confusa TaxID=1583 RepID=UPI0018F115F4|nr:hypothetical protein [Weissella confusa]MBJ7623548.1 hypothetical protein [Weissella confusa]MBJ7664889.1 hypothetical protein [Weissella confusa]MBJ7675068.1 hypothetical protein [Weissella confusa]